MPTTSFRVGEWRVDPDALEIVGPGGSRRLEAKPMAVLVALAERPGETCTRDDLLHEVWGDRFVGEEVLTHAVWELRRAFGDPARQPRVVQTVQGRGYRLLLPVERDSAPPPEPARRPRRPGWVVAVAAVLLLAGGTVWAVASRWPGPPRRILVLAPKVVAPAADPRAERLAHGVEVALLSELANLDGVAAVSPEYLGAEERDVDAALRAVPAEEVLVSELRLGPRLGTLTLRRERAAPRAVLASEVVSLRLDEEEASLLGETVRVELRRAYAELGVRAGVPPLDVREADYRDFLEIRRRLARGEVADAEPELERAEAIVASSPRFLEGHLLAAELGRSLYSASHRFADFERAERHLARARRLAPNDPRPLLQGARLELERGEAEHASAIVLELARLAPDDVQLPLLEARIAEKRGRLDEAAAILRTAVRRFPSWQNHYRLADLAARTGDVGTAREELQGILERVPGNTWARAKLAELELFYGDLEASELHFEALTAVTEPRGGDLVNLGTARALRGDWPGAVAAFERALERLPDHPAALLNLADALVAQGDAPRARALCSRLPQTADLLVRAQCEVHLGRPLEAVALAQRGLATAAEEPERVYQAAAVFAQVGDRTSALVNVRRARELGVAPRWFGLPAFASLAADPEFRSAVESGPAR